MIGVKDENFNSEFLNEAFMRFCKTKDGIYRKATKEIELIEMIEIYIAGRF